MVIPLQKLSEKFPGLHVYTGIIDPKVNEKGLRGLSGCWVCLVRWVVRFSGWLVAFWGVLFFVDWLLFLA
ncbi:hypothetical protein LINPERHAP1_LOCUS10413 [Linum perenne]